MSSTATIPREEQVFRRVLGTYDGVRPGPTVLAQGGIHGNEPGGVIALQRVLARLHDERPEFHGRFVAVAGNLGALARGRRFIARDLNRRWQEPTLAQLRAQDPALDGEEDREQRELLAVYDECLAQAKGPLVFLDLHSSSADGPPFTGLADTLPNRRLALALPVPMILGLEECIDGAVMEFFNNRGQVGIAVEGGRHDDPRTVDNLEAACLLAMRAVGALPIAELDVGSFREVLARAATGLPRVLEIRHRQAIRPEDGFEMEPGYVSFQRVRAGELLARDARGELHASDDGIILLPLYQGQGEDGYFVARTVRRFWLRLAAFLRHARLDAVVHLLPGVRRLPGDEHTLVVEPNIARLLVVQLFHLLGFRRKRPVDGKLQFSRRWATPASYRLRPRP